MKSVAADKGQAPLVPKATSGREPAPQATDGECAEFFSYLLVRDCNVYRGLLMSFALQNPPPKGRLICEVSGAKKTPRC